MSDKTLTLGEQIDLQIRTTGPISVATYMGLCLTHPSKGYYRAGEPIGTSGDFITAPEISQMFGELIGFWLVNLWQQMGEPKSFTLLELGPGRGTLMADMLRVACRAPGFRDGLRLRLFETSPPLMAEQQARLEVYEPKWLQNFESFDEGPILVVANEFFDALPIRQFIRKEDGWHERQVGLVEGKRAFGLSPTPIPAASMPDAVAHAEPDATSNQTVRAVHWGAATGNFLGRLEVARDAQKTDAAQNFKAILLEKGAAANAKPELEIFADDVKCAHGAAIGALDATEAFYMAARGIPPEVAKKLLVRAFIADAFAGVVDEILRDELLEKAVGALDGEVL